MTDQRIVTRVLAGKRYEFSRLVERYLQSAHAVACAQLGNPTDAEDVVQEAFLKAYMELPQLREPARFGAWLLTIVRNQCHSWHRSRLREADRVQRAAKEATRLVDVVGAADGLELRNLVDSLEEQQREVLLLHYFSGHSVREIGQLLSISESATKKRLQRARESLASVVTKELQRTYEPPDNKPERVKRIVGLVAVAMPDWLKNVHPAPVPNGGMSLPAKAAIVFISGAAALGGLMIFLVCVYLVVRTSVGSFNEASAASAPARHNQPPTAVQLPVAEAIAASVPQAPPQESSPEGEFSAPNPQLIRCLALDTLHQRQSHTKVSLFPVDGPLTREALFQPPVDANETACTGEADLVAPQPGRYLIRGSRIGSVAYAVLLAEERQLLTVAALRLRPAGLLAGIVVNEQGAPLQDATISLTYLSEPMRRDNFWPDLTRMKTSQGRFRYSDLPAGEVAILAEAPGYASARVKPVSIGDPNVRIVLSTGATVHGTVVAKASGAPLPGVRVEASGDGAESSITTGPDGQFDLRGIPEGIVNFVVAGGGYFIEEGPVQAPIRGAGGPGNILLKATKAARLAGVIVDAAANEPVRACVQLVRIDAVPVESLGSMMTGVEGDFSYGPLAAGAYELQVSQISSAHIFEPLTPEETTFAIAGGEDREVQIRLRRARSILVTGRVVDLKGNPATDAEVWYSCQDDPPEVERHTTVDGWGRFEFEVPPEQPGTLIAHNFSDVAQLRIAGPRQLDNVKLVLLPGARIEGRVYDEAGMPFEQVRVTLRALEGQPMALRDVSRRTEALGAYHYHPLLAGDYSLEFALPDDPTVVHQSFVKVSPGHVYEDLVCQLAREQ